MTKDLMKEFNNVIANVVESKTFSLEAVESIKNLRDRAEELEKDNDNKDEEIKRLRKIESDISQKESNLRVREDKLRNDLMEFNADKVEQYELKIDKEYAEQYSRQLEGLLDKLVRNTEYRKTVNSNRSTPEGYETVNSNTSQVAE